MIDWTVNLGNMLVIAGLFGSLIIYAFRSGRFAQTIAAMKEDIVEMKEVSKELSRIITSMAVQTSRMDSAAERVNLLDKRIEELRKGNGWVTGHSRSGIDGEYK